MNMKNGENSASPGHHRPKALAWLLLAGGGLGLLAGAAFLVGGQAEKQLVRTLAKLHGEQELKVELSRYQRGFFTSRAVTRLAPVTTRPGAPAEEDGAIIMEHHIWHGPLPLTLLGAAPGITRPTPGPRLAVIHSRLAGQSKIEEPFEAHTTIGLGGQVETTFRLPPGHHHGSAWPWLNVNWQALTGTLVFPWDMAQLTGEVTSQGMALAARPPAGAPRRLAELEGIRLRFSYNQEDDLQGGKTLQAEQQLAVDRLGTAQTEYGPLRLRANWRRLDRQAAGRLFSLAPWWRQLLLGPRPPGQAEIPPATAQKMVETLSALLAKAPELAIAPVQLQSPHGEAGGRLQLAYQGQDDHRPFHPIMLLSGLQMAIEARAPAPLLASLAREPQHWHQPPAGPTDEIATPAPAAPAAKPEEPLAGLFQRGLLVHDDDTDQVSFQLHYEAGELIINQRPAPLQILRHLWR